jgi:hypothetical protein
MGRSKFEAVKEFKYLGSVFSSNNNVSTEGQMRNLVAQKASLSLLSVINSACVCRTTKIRIQTPQTEASYAMHAKSGRCLRR